MASAPPPAPTSVIQLAPASAAFIENRISALGPWVIGGFLDCMLLGIIFCQVYNFYRTRPPTQGPMNRYYNWMVIVVLVLSILKSGQTFLVVWVQNVVKFADPDHARLLVAQAWWQVSMPLTTAIIGTTVQSFFLLRFYMFSRNLIFSGVILSAMCLGLAGVCLAVVNILAGNVKLKLMWFLVHFISVFMADFMITAGTIHALYQRRTEGLQSTQDLVNRLLRLVFESGAPPTIIAAIDLIMTQTLVKTLLWHMLLNILLAKVYVLGLLYTFNSIQEFRNKEQAYVSNDLAMSNGSRRTGLSGLRSPAKPNQIFIETEVTTHDPITPNSGVGFLEKAQMSPRYGDSPQKFGHRFSDV